MFKKQYMLGTSLNISTSHITGTAGSGTFKIILRLTRYMNYLLSYLITWIFLSASAVSCFVVLLIVS